MFQYPVGRIVESERIAGFLRAVESWPAALVLDGEAGIGKSTVWEAGLQRAREAGMHVLSARAWGAESVRAWATIAELLADMARTVDNISDGRLILGIGSGWKQKDYDEYGYEFGTAGGRLDELAAALPRIESRLGKLNPQPVRDIPILIGGQGEKKTLRMVAEHAHIWHGFTDASTYPGKAEVLDRHCADVGRDPGAIERSSGVPERSPEAAVEGAESLVALGVTLLTIGVNGPDYDLTVAEALCRWRDSRQSGVS